MVLLVRTTLSSQGFLSSRRLRGSTPKRVVFYSDYLKDFNTGNEDLKQPAGGSQKADIVTKEGFTQIDRDSKQHHGAETERPRSIGRYSRGRDQPPTDLLSARGDYKRVSLLPEKERHVSQPEALVGGFSTPHSNNLKYGDYSSTSRGSLQTKEGIRERIAKLNEKLNSPSSKLKSEEDPLRYEPLPTEYKPSPRRSPRRSSPRR